MQQSKPFSWSYSRLKNFEVCPKRHWHIDIQKDIKEEESEDLQWGDQVHKGMAARCSAKRTPLPLPLAHFEPWAVRVLAGADAPGASVLVEQKLAITKEFGPCEYFDRTKQVWFRAVGDVIKIIGRVALIADWKTGKVLEDSQQLALAAACVFAHYPEVEAVRSAFVWLKHNTETVDTFHRNSMAKMWGGLWPRIQALEHAHNTTSYPPKPGRLCKRWCPVTVCPHHGT